MEVDEKIACWNICAFEVKFFAVQAERSVFEAKNTCCPSFSYSLFIVFGI